jgi:hypothetical protein
MELTINQTPKYSLWASLPNTPGLLRRILFGTYIIPKGANKEFPLWGMYVAPIVISVYCFPSGLDFNLFGIRLPSINYFTNVEELLPIPTSLRNNAIQNGGFDTYNAISVWIQEYMVNHPGAKVAFLPMIRDRYEGIIPAGAHVKAIKIGYTVAAGTPIPIFQNILTGEFTPV